MEFKVEDRVLTPYGVGVVAKVSDDRILVRHDQNVYGGEHSRTEQDFIRSYNKDELRATR